ncbi:MAG: aldehyde dehydrogenase family protein [Pseudomonadota bacterium]|nr:aldehyde dehydrogenase family protein [Pseudomonadota bacterium]
MNLSQFYIDGNWVDPVGNQKLDVINPATEETVGQLSLGSEQDVDLAVSAAKKAFGTFSRTSVVERLELLTEIRNIYKRRYNEVAEAILTEMGAPITLASGAQSSVGLAHLKTAIRVLNDKEFEYKHNNMLIREEPIGVCGLITPWNWPINQVVSKLAPCLAAGCTSVLKPSEISPLSAIIFAEIMHEAGTPAGVFNMVHGYGPIVGEAMSKHPNIDMMSFTGSTRGGVSVAKSSAETVKRVSQELGGKSPNIILDDACFEQSVSRGVSGCMNNTGQSCNAPTRMLVPKNRHDEAAQIAKRVAESMKTGDPKSNDTDIGPLVSETQLKKVQKLVESGINSEATLVTGGVGKPAGLNKGYYVKPTVFSNVHNHMEIAKEEIFGPVLSIIPYANDSDAIDIANDTEYGLAAYVSGENPEKMMFFARNLNAGQIHLNYMSGGSDAPFGGFKKSGNGREKAEWGLDEFLEVKAIMG